jgi:hypothetical protein
MSEPADRAAPGPHQPPGGGVPRPKPGVIPLRPLGVGEILDGAIAYVRGNPGVTLGFSAIVITITQLVELPVSASLTGASQDLTADGRVPTSDDLIGLVGSAVGGLAVSGLVSFVANTVLTGLLITVLGQAVLGRRMGLGPAWAATRSRLPGLLGLSLLTTLVLTLIVGAGFIPLIIAAAAGSSSAVTPAILAILVVAGIAVWLGTLWSMITPAYVLEHIPVMRAFRRSTELVRGQWWRVFGILLLGGIIATIVSSILALPFGFVAGLFGAPGSAGDLIVTALGGIVAGTITAPFSAGISGLLYFDQRMRREAFDLELLRATETPGGTVPTGPRPPSAPEAPWAPGAPQSPEALQSPEVPHSPEVSLEKGPQTPTDTGNRDPGHAADDEDPGPQPPR